MISDRPSNPGGSILAASHPLPSIEPLWIDDAGTAEMALLGWLQMNAAIGGRESPGDLAFMRRVDLRGFPYVIHYTQGRVALCFS